MVVNLSGDRAIRDARKVRCVLSRDAFLQTPRLYGKHLMDSRAGCSYDANLLRCLRRAGRELR